ncbi:MAG: type II restriction endonuclease [Clostridia bacterium]|nr:type II restriction endonuclease [Clostridia bacterium]
MNSIVILEARKKYHQNLVDHMVLTLSSDGVASNADSSNAPSKVIAEKIAIKLGARTAPKLKGQTSGTLFEQLTMQFINETFPQLQHLRPGDWTILNLGNQSTIKTSDFAQYEHLAYLSQLMSENRQLSTMLGNDYMVAPDVVVYRDLCEDGEINKEKLFINDEICKMSDLRKQNGGKPILHASISAKWTMRSDRAQNSRTEALNLIRNRKGHLPHIVVVTGEPLPSRLASLALGTGDLDCVYHFALYELIEAVKEYGKNGREDIIETLDNLVEGKRLKDISDLPLDLSV